MQRTTKLIATTLALLATQPLSALFAPASAVELIKTSAADRSEANAYQKPNIVGRKPKIGLALGGGGARGAAEVGVLKVLNKAGVKFDYVTGTSIGSVVGGFYCSGVDLEWLEDEFENGHIMKEFMTVPLTIRILAAPIMYIPRLLGANQYDGLYNGSKFRKYLMSKASEHHIQHLPIPFGAVVFNVIDGKPYIIRSGELGYAMQASCAVPSLRKPVEIDGHLFADGGVICNLPVKQCRELGADIVIAVNIDEGFCKEPLDTFRKPGSMAKRMITWGLWDIDEPQGQMADIEIHPDVTGISLISTKKKDAQRGVKAGIEAATAALPEIRKKLEAAGIALTPDDTASVETK